MKKNKKWFSIIEIIIWMFIFSLGIISVYAVISSSVRINDYNRHYIISSNLAREQLELLRNNRDYNYARIQKFDQINPANSDFSNTLEEWIYQVENNFSALAGFPLKITKQNEGSNFWVDILENANTALREKYRLYFDETQRIYTFDDDGGNNKKTPYIKYIEISRDQQDEIFITSKVIWESKGRHDFEIKTILTDWKQL